MELTARDDSDAKIVSAWAVERCEDYALLDQSNVNFLQSSHFDLFVSVT
jgi:hypothetical protein